jgi:hypothetical protein
MPLPSLYQTDENDRPWSVMRAAVYGAVIGVLAAAFKAFGPQRLASGAADLIDTLLQIAVAAFGFALLCAVAAIARNFIARHLIWREGRWRAPFRR